MTALAFADTTGTGFYNGPAINSNPSFYDTWIKHRLSAGFTLAYTRLMDGSRSRNDTFLGNITEIGVENEFSLAPVIKYDLSDYMRLGLSYSYLKINTLNWNNGQGDGYAKFRGAALQFDFNYPMYEYRFFPHAGVGCAFYDAAFDEYGWWSHGYSNNEAWAIRNYTYKTASGKYREIHVDDVIAPFVTIGASYRTAPNLEFDLSFRAMFADPDCEFGYVHSDNRFERRATGSFEINNYSILLTASYVF